MPRDDMDSKLEKTLTEKIKNAEYERSKLVFKTVQGGSIVMAVSVALAGALTIFRPDNPSSKLTGSTPDSVQVEQLLTRVEKLEKALKATSQQGDNSKISEPRMSAIEDKVDALSESILVDADKAVTARLLREKQSNLEKQVDSLAEDNQALRQDMSNLTMFVIAVPVIGAAITLISSQIQRSKMNRSLKTSKK